MTKKTPKKELSKIIYYPNTPDPMWKQEVEALMPYLSGKGVDVGCGKRSIFKDDVRVDIDPKVHPDFVASGDKLPFKDKEFDYLYGIHAFEHFENPVKTLKEWLRVVKKGGIVAIVHPDIRYTKKQNPEIDNPGLRENPFNKHWHEHRPETFLIFLEENLGLGFEILDSGTACGNWSFYFILRKI